MPMWESNSTSWKSTLLGESRYLTTLQVFAIGDRSQSSISDLELGADTNQLKTHVFDLGANRIDQDQILRDKIIAALKALIFREQHVIVQFWSRHVVGKHQLLTTIDQPFGLGVADDALCFYRRDSERNSFLVDKEHEEEDHSPAARVLRRELPEWTLDLTSYTQEQFSQQACAIRCGFRGYLGLPVFDSTKGSCVGVVEVLTSSKYTSYAYEVQQIHDALKTVDLRTHQAFDCPVQNVPIYHRQIDFVKIYDILKMACDIHRLPLAQTWAVSEHTSFVSHEKVLEKSCSSFDARCVGKACMSQTALPFHVQDLGFWSFMEACRKRHLDRSCGPVGRAWSTRGSCFCEDVTKLGEEEYSLVHNARMNGLTSCFAIFLHSVEAGDDYVLEFYLPSDIKDIIHVMNLVQTLKQKIEIASGFELGASSYIHVVKPPPEVSISMITLQTASGATTNNNQLDIVTSDSESMVVNLAIAESASVSNQWPTKQIYPDKCRDIITRTENLAGDDILRHESNVICVREHDNMIPNSDVSMRNMSDNITDGREKSNSSKQGRKRKIDSLTMEAVEKHVGIPIHQAAKNLGVGQSTLKRFCRDHDMPSWPMPKHIKKTIPNGNLKPSQNAHHKQNLQRSSIKRFCLYFVVLLIVRAKRWSCLTKSHGFSGKWWSCGKHSNLPFESNFIYQTTFMIVRLRRWRNKISKRNAMHNSVSESTTKPKCTIDFICNAYSRVVESDLVRAFPKKTVANNSDAKMVTVKVTFEVDMIKFQFPISSGLLELKNEVARRIKLDRSRIRLKYKDEDNDVIFLASDDDLHFLLGFAANNSTIRLIADDYY